MGFDHRFLSLKAKIRMSQVGYTVAMGIYFGGENAIACFPEVTIVRRATAYVLCS